MTGPTGPQAQEAGEFVLVPAEPTHEMEYALSQALDSGDYSIGECLRRANAVAAKTPARVVSDADVERGCIAAVEATGFNVANWPDKYPDANQLRKVIRAALSTLQSGAEGKEGWLPIESAPRDGTRVLLCQMGSHFTYMGWWQEAFPDQVDVMGGDAGFVDSDFSVFYPGRSFGQPDYQGPGNQPTHWQHMPSAKDTALQPGQGEES